MPLAEYLASEQARPEVRQAIVHGIADAPERMISTGTMGAWSVVQVTVHGESVSAYYRPDGDRYVRYVVTDLGEGVRALRLRTGQPLDGWQNWFDGIVDSTAGVIRKQDVRADQLPDALCRVMLASLRVAGVGL